MKLCGFEVGLDRPFFLIAGPCVIESPVHTQVSGAPEASSPRSAARSSVIR